MKWVRLLLLGTGVVVVLLVVVAAVASTSSFQTWVARRAIAARPEWRATVGSVSAGLKRVEATDVRLEPDGAVLTLPRVEAQVSFVTAGLERKLTIARLVAKGWTLDLSREPGTGAVAVAPGAEGDRPRPEANRIPAPPRGPSPAEAAAQAFAGVLARLALPVDASIDDVELQGEVILPGMRGKSQVTLRGGALGAGRTGRFHLTASATLIDAAVKVVDLSGTLVATMDPARHVIRLESNLEVVANGRRIPQGVRFRLELAAARAAAGESYAATLFTGGREVLNVEAELNRGAPRLRGKWRFAVREADVAALEWRVPLPALTATGRGTFATDAGFATVGLSGHLSATADHLAVWGPALVPMGELHLEADFDLSEQDGVLGVRRFESAISALQPIATVRALQAFDFNPRTGALRAADATRDLLGVGLQGLPLAWLNPLLTDLRIAGGPLRGELVATPRGGGIAIRSVSPITAGNVSVVRAGRLVAEELDLRFSTATDYSPQGWQTELQGGTATRGKATLFTLDARAGQLTGNNQAIKATGKITADLPAVLAQPFAAGAARLAGGEAAIEFVASLNGGAELQANVALRQLAAVGENHDIALPAVSVELRADVGIDGRVVFNAPIVIERNGRNSDLTVAGTVVPEGDQSRTIEAQVVSTNLAVEDGRILAAVIPPRVNQKQPPGGRTPPWAGWHGSVQLRLKNILWSEALTLSNASGQVRLGDDGLKLENAQIGWGESGRATGSGVVAFDAVAPRPYTLTADVVVKDLNAGPLLRVRNPNQPPLVEGRFDLVCNLSGRAMTPGELAANARGEFHFTSKGGLFRGLPVSTTSPIETSSRLAGLFASAGSMLGGLAGRREEPDIVSRSEAVAELARGLNPISYDQLSVTVSRDAALNTSLTNFVLISPELRVTGSGTALHQPGRSLLDDSLAMEFRLRARGRQGDLLKYLGVLDILPDDLGYTACTFSLNVSGTLGNPDVSELNSRLALLGLDKGGLSDKAAEFLNKIRGGK